MITSMTPEELIQRRFTAFVEKDFMSIYGSYHPEATFLRFFPDANAYVNYAEEEIAPTFQIVDCQVLRSDYRDEIADVLFSQRLNHNGELLDSLEIARCRRNSRGEWSFLAGLRLDSAKLTEDFLICSWDLLIAAGNDLWI